MKRHFLSAVLVSCSAFVLLPGVLVFAAESQAAKIASDGKAEMQVVVGPEASDRTREAASILGAYLSRISGAKFDTKTGDGSGGIVVGRPDDFKKLPFEAKFETGPFNREHYILRSGPRGVWLIGAGDLAVEHAVWDLLYRLGYRQFFPGKVWCLGGPIRSLGNHLPGAGSGCLRSPDAGGARDIQPGNVRSGCPGLDNDRRAEAVGGRCPIYRKNDGQSG